MINDELLVTQLGSTTLRLEMDRIPLWRGDDVPIRQLVEDFARYLYLPRLSDASVLTNAIERGLGLLTWAQDAFAYAERYDKETARYQGLVVSERMHIAASDGGLLACRMWRSARSRPRAWCRPSVWWIRRCSPIPIQTLALDRCRFRRPWSRGSPNATTAA